MAKVCWVLKVPLPLPKSTLAVLEPVFAVVISSFPSPLTSPRVTPYGLEPVAKVCWVLKVPLPLPKSKLTLLEVLFAVMRSSIPSPFTSPSVTILGMVPAAKVACGAKFTVGAEVAVFKSTLLLLSLLFAVMISSLPSPFTSPRVTERGLIPVAKVC